jgi:hypothetical protein
MSRKNSFPSEPMPTKNLFEACRVTDNLSELLGEVLTIIDASTEGEKNNAIKGLIRHRFSEMQSWFTRLAYEDKSKDKLWAYGVVQKN